jgi:hypothetical protein
MAGDDCGTSSLATLVRRDALGEDIRHTGQMNQGYVIFGDRGVVGFQYFPMDRTVSASLKEWARETGTVGPLYAIKADGRCE